MQSLASYSISVKVTFGGVFDVQFLILLLLLNELNPLYYQTQSASSDPYTIDGSSVDVTTNYSV